MSRLSDRAERFLLGTIGVVALFVFWEYAANHNIINVAVTTSPSRIAVAFVNQWQSGDLIADLRVSLGEFAVGFTLSLIVGVGLGIAMGMSRMVEYATDPFIWFLYSAPLIALYPLIVVWLGFGYTTVVAVTFLLTVVSIIVNTMAGVHSVERIRHEHPT